MVSIRWRDAMRMPTSSAIHGSKHVTQTTARVECVIKNVGKSPAWIEMKRITLVPQNPDIVPVEPDLKRVSDVDPLLEPVAPDEELIWNTDPSCEGMRPWGGGQVGMIYGVIEYRDIFEKPRWTRFGYWADPAKNKLERVTRVANYNKYA